MMLNTVKQKDAKNNTKLIKPNILRLFFNFDFKDNIKKEMTAEYYFFLTFILYSLYCEKISSKHFAI